MKFRPLHDRVVLECVPEPVRSFSSSTILRFLSVSPAL